MSWELSRGALEIFYTHRVLELYDIYSYICFFSNVFYYSFPYKETKQRQTLQRTKSKHENQNLHKVIT